MITIPMTVASSETVVPMGISSTEKTIGMSIGAGYLGVSSYEDLKDKPRIEGVELIGDKTFEELNLQSLTNTELEAMLTL